MGNKCFRPKIDNNLPVYITTMDLAFADAQKIYQQKKNQNDSIIEVIEKNENRKGNLKKIFDHLVSHQLNVIPSIKYCNKKVSHEKSISSIVISTMYLKKLVKMISEKKSKSTLSQRETINTTKGILSPKYFKPKDYDVNLKNLFHEVESYFFDLLVKILVYNNKYNKQIWQKVSLVVIDYSTECQDKFVTKKQLKNVLDIFLNIVVQKNICNINKDTYLPFYAYSLMLSKTKYELINSQFIEKHFNFILKLFFEINDTKKSNKSILQTENFNLFEDCVDNIIKEFIFSTQNKSIKEKILDQIMIELDIQKFQDKKTQKLEDLIFQNLNQYDRQHFMLDWLSYLIRYIIKRPQPLVELKDSRKLTYQQSIDQFQSIQFKTPLKNISSLQSKQNAISTLHRWFNKQLLNTEKTLQYYSDKILYALLINLYNPNKSYENLNQKSQTVILYFLEKNEKRLEELILILNGEMRKAKNLIYLVIFGGSQQSTQLGSNRKAYDIQKMQIVWLNGLQFILNPKIKEIKYQLSEESIQEIFNPLKKEMKNSINIIYLIQLSAISLHWTDLSNENSQKQIFSYLISLTNCKKVSNIDFEYQEKTLPKLRFLFQTLYTKNETLLYSYLQHNKKNLMKQQQNDQIYWQILIMIIVINQIFQFGKKGKSKRQKQLDVFLNELLSLMNQQKNRQTQLLQCYQRHNKLIQIEIDFIKVQKGKLRQYQKLQHIYSVQLKQKQIVNESNSITQSRLQISEQNPDRQFRYAVQMIMNP